MTADRSANGDAADASDASADGDAEADARRSAGTDPESASRGADPDGPGGDRAGESGGRDGDSADGSTGGPAVEERLDDALERVAHGATVSVPSILLQRALTVAFTAVLTNAFAAGAYGLFALARRLQRFLLRLAMGLSRGLSRYLPNADSPDERDALATFAGVLLVGVGTAFGGALFVGADLVAGVAGEGPQFRRYLRVFAVGLPAAALLFAVVEVQRGLEAVVPLNLTHRIGFPAAQLAVGVVAALVVGDLLVAAGGVVLAMGGVGVAGAAWLARARGLSPRVRGPGVAELRREYLRFTAPLFAGTIATTTQRLGFYPLIALYLSGVAGGVFAVGVLVGQVVRLPLMGVNQFIPPVAAALNEEGHRGALERLYHVTSRLVLVGTTALGVPAVVYRKAIMGLFGPAFLEYAFLLPGFVVAQYAACAAGSVGILLMMTDHQRALLAVNLVVTAILIVTAVPLTLAYGLPGLVGGYVLMLTVNNGLEVVTLYHLEGLQPFTRRHLRPVLAAVPLAAVALAARSLLTVPLGAVAGTALGLVAYAVVLRHLGFTPAERRLARTLVDRYRGMVGRSAG